MIKIYIFIFIIFLNFNCTINDVVKHHGIHFLDEKQKKLKISEMNNNDVRKILGTPSVTNTFDNDIWIYIERKTTVSKLKNFGRKEVLLNNALVLEFDKRGLLVKKDFYNKDQMNKLKINENETLVNDKKDTFIKSALSSLRQKINDPLGKRSIID